MDTSKLIKNMLLIGLLSLSMTLYSQSSSCDTTAIYAHVNPAGYQRLYVPNQSCSMYFYNPTPMYGIDAHISAANLGIPQLIVGDAQENTDVFNALYAQGIFPTNYEVWMGITDSATPFTWRTFSGSPAPSYTNWASGEPNNRAAPCRILGSCAFCTGADVYYCNNGEDCAVMSSNSGGNWLDITCKGTNMARVCVLELPTCPVIIRPRDTSICSSNTVNVSTSVLSGGTAPYSYSWNPGSISGSNASLSPTVTTTYTAEASDRWSCRADSTFTITVASTTIPVIATTQSSVCKGTSDTISISSLSATATYVWGFGAGAYTVSGSASGPYVVSWGISGSKSIALAITDSGCVIHTTASIVVDSVNAAFTMNPSATACVNQQVVVSAAGTSASAVYNWNFGSANVISGSGVGPYTLSWPSTGSDTVSLTVTDNGCTDSTSQVITIGRLNAAHTGHDTTVCSGAQVHLGGIAISGINYIWSPSTYLNGTSVSSVVFSETNATLIPDTNHYMLVATLGSCTDTGYVSVIVSPIPSVAITASGSTTFCDGDSVILQTIVPSAVRYVWSTSGVDTLSSLVVKTSGSYAVTAYDANGCSMISRSPAIVTVNARPSVSHIAQQDETCPNAKNGKLIVAGAGGASPYSFTWNTSPIQTGDSAISLAPGSYTVTVTDSNHCADTAIFTIQPAVPIAISVDSTFDLSCAASNDGRVYIHVTGGHQTYTYTWIDSVSHSAVATSQNLTGAAPGTYMMIVTDANTCTDTARFNISAPMPLSIRIDSNYAPSCADGHDGHAGITVTGGSGIYIYDWSDSATHVSVGSRSVVTTLVSGSYIVSVTDSRNCSASVNIDVPVSVRHPSVHVDSMKEVSCSGKKDGAIYVTAIGAYVPVSYLWSNGATTSAITGLNPDSFSVKITDAYGCKAYTGLILTSPPAMVISPVSNFQISYGGSQQVSIRVLPDTPGYIYLWSPTVGLSCTDCPSPIVSPLLSTSYTLTVAQSATGCRDSITFSVFVEGLNHIYVPNAFTPNGDGVNDVHHISFSGTILFYEMEIFDRWGEMVYRSNDPERGWDGTFKSAKLPPENYTYQMSVTFATGEPIHTKGAITLIR